MSILSEVALNDVGDDTDFPVVVKAQESDLWGISIPVGAAVIAPSTKGFCARLHAGEVDGQDIILTRTLTPGELERDVAKYEYLTPTSAVRRWLALLHHEGVLAIRHQVLLQEFPNLTITSAGGAIPFQAEGVFEGYPFYFRYRGGRASLSVLQKDGEEAGDLLRPLYDAFADYGHPLSGTLDDAEFHTLFSQLAQELTVAGIVWEFEYADEEGNPNSLYMHGVTRQQAREALQECLQDRENYPHLAGRTIAKESITVDKRVFLTDVFHPVRVARE